MISIERTRELLPEETKGLSDEEVAEIRDATQMLAELIFDQWMEDRKKKIKEASAKDDKDPQKL